MKRMNSYLKEVLAYWAPELTPKTAPETLTTNIMICLEAFQSHQMEMLTCCMEETKECCEPMAPSLATCEASPAFRPESDEERIMREIRERLDELREKGICEDAIAALFQEAPHISPIVVKQDGRLFLPDYSNREVEMGLIEKTLYLLFLRHPEGLYQKDLVDYTHELQDLYRKVNGGILTPRGMKSIASLTDPTSNSCDEKLSRIRRTFSSLFQPRIANAYSITRGKGELRRIPLEAGMIRWE